ncbi:MAG: hypothetical protein EBQ92_02825 [Proteobacteria bacterium]|nr:hypothetical protein [Pseudomonadota bacterium]
MRAIFYLVVLLVGLSKELMAFEMIGSDGPTPFAPIPAPRKVTIPLQETISSYSVLEGTDKLAYIDSNLKLRVYDFNSGEEQQYGGFINELFPVSGAGGKTVLSSDLKKVVRVVGKNKGQEIGLPGSSQFLLWDKNDLYLLKKLEKLNGEAWRISYFIYNQDKNQIRHNACDFYPANNPKNLRIGEGHLVPNLLLYSEKHMDRDTELTIYTLNLKARNGKCQIEAQSREPEYFKGNVTSVNWAFEGREVVVFTDHETTNLYFGTPGAFSIGILPVGRSYIPNTKSSVVININRQKGVGVYSLLTGRYFTLDLSVDRGFLEGNQIWVDSEGEQLFISTRERRDKWGGRALHTVSLKGLNR